MEFTPDGLTLDTQAEIQTLLETNEKGEISTSLDVSTSSPLGQLNRIEARAIRLLEEAIAAFVNAIDPDSASGDALLRLCALTGTIREPSSASRVEVVCDLDAGTYLAGELTAYPTGRPEDGFANLQAVTSAGGHVPVIFQATATGPVQAAANTLVIAAAVSGWHSIVSHPDATPGANVESEAALRARRNQEVAAPGSSSLEGIEADLTQNVPLIETATVYENVGDVTDGNGVPPHSIEAIVYGPDPATTDDNDQVAAQIFASVAAGIGTHGNTTRNVTDSQGQIHAISFSRPVDVDVDVDVTATVGATYAGDAELEAAIRAGALATWRPGLDAAWSAVVGWAMPLVLRVTSVSLNGTPLTDVPIAIREKAKISSVTLHTTVGVP